MLLVSCDDGGDADPGDTAVSTVDASDATGVDTSDTSAPDLADGSDASDTDEPQPPQARFEPGPDGTFPFPFDAFTTEADTLTGLRLNLAAGNTRLIDDGLDNGAIALEALLPTLNRLDGFSLVAPISLAWEGDLDVDALPERPGPEDGIWLVALEPDDPDFGVHREVTLTTIERLRNIMVLEPVSSLEPSRTYGLIVGTSLMAADARFTDALSVEVPSDAALEDAHAALAPLREQLPALGLEVDEVAMATVFTTQSAPHTMERVMASVVATDPSPVIELDGGTPRLFDVAEIPDVPMDINDLTGVAAVVRATVDAPDFRAADGDVVLDANNDVTPGETRSLPFWIVLPDAAADGPVPLVVLQHGASASKERVFYIAGTLAQAGFASIAMDLPDHGERAGDGNFFAIDDPPVARGTFLQAEADLLAYMHAARKLGSEVGIDVLGAGGTPDGVDDITTANGLYYIGVSLGGITGTVANALSPHSAGAVLNVTGGGLSGLIAPFLIVLGDNPELKLQVRVLFQTLIDAADPLTFVDALRTGLAPDGRPRDVIVQIAIDDNIVRNETSRRLAEALELPLVCPCPSEGTVFEGMATIPAPHVGSGLTIFADAVHGGLLTAQELDPVSVDSMQDQIARFFTTDLETGTGEIVALP